MPATDALARSGLTSSGRVLGARIHPVLIIASVWLIASILIAARGDFASNDDWVYGSAVEALLRTGRFSLPSPASANVMLQVYWGALFCLPLGFSYDALRISTSVLALGGVVALYGMVREAGGSRRIALIAALALELNPLWLQLGNTFMTDVPFTALMAIAMWQLARWARTDDGRSLVAAFAIAAITILLRQFAWIFVVGIGVTYVLKSRFSVTSVVIAISVIVGSAVGHLAFQHWLIATHRTVAVVGASVREVVPVFGAATILRVGVKLFVLLPYVGLLMAPVQLACGGGSAWAALKARDRTALLAIGLTLALEFAATSRQFLHMPFMGNILDRWGLGPLTLRDTFILGVNWPAPPFAAGIIWTLLLVLGMLLGALLLFECVAVTIGTLRHVARRSANAENSMNAGMVTVFVLYSLILALLSLKLMWFDRYLLVLAPPLTLLVLIRRSDDHSASRAGLVGASFLIAGFAYFGVTAAHDYFAWQRSRLIATKFLQTKGIRPVDIDGGYEYNGRYLFDGNYRKSPQKSYWWVRNNRYVVASGPLPGYLVAQSFEFTSWLTLRPRHVVVLRRTDQGS